MNRTDKYYVYTIKSIKYVRRKDFCKFRNKNSVSNYLKFEIGTRIIIKATHHTCPESMIRKLNS